MPPKEEMKKLAEKTKSDEDPFDAAEHKVVNVHSKHIIPLNI